MSSSARFFQMLPLQWAENRNCFYTAEQAGAFQELSRSYR